jgi:hypothetical protein
MSLDIEFKALSALPDRIDAASDVVVAMPFIDPELAKRSATQLARRAGIRGLLYAVYDDRRSGFVTAANAVFRRSEASFFAYVAQDAFSGRDWLKRGVDALQSKSGGLLAFNDGKWNGALAAFGLVKREWALANYDGELFMPGYNSHYADAELTVIAMQQKKLIYDPAAVLIEVDWQKENQSVNGADQALFRLRGRSNYDGKVVDAQLSNLFR